MNLLRNVHEVVSNPILNVNPTLVKHSYEYYHYKCDGFNDVGWGCGYRTLQTLCSWVRLLAFSRDLTVRDVPTIPDIQKALVAMGDKEASFSDSREWIGSVEVSMCLDYFYNVPGKIIHVNSGENLKKYSSVIKNHFETIGAPIMMGGDIDASSKGILGICESENELFFLILDPHYVGKTRDPSELALKGWISWRNVDSFLDSSFYNLCLPQHK